MQTVNAWVLFSINKPHTDNIKAGKKTVELRLRAPKKDKLYKALIYETKKHGGCGKIIGEFTARNKGTYKGISNGVLLDLIRRACVSKKELLDYTDKWQKEVTEIAIYDLIIYEKPKELSEFYKPCPFGEDRSCFVCEKSGFGLDNSITCFNAITRPPQSWCYVEELI